MIHIVGAGPGDPELITVKGARYLAEADVVIYAGSLVNPHVQGGCGDSQLGIYDARRGRRDHCSSRGRG